MIYVLCLVGLVFTVLMWVLADVWLCVWCVYFACVCVACCLVCFDV